MANHADIAGGASSGAPLASLELAERAAIEEESNGRPITVVGRKLPSIVERDPDGLLEHGVASERSSTPPESALEEAAAEGIGANFGRWLRFVGHIDGRPIELQAIEVPTNYAPKTRFAHALSAADAVRLLEEAERWGAPGVFTIVNNVDPAIATRDVPGCWHDAKKGASTTDRDIRSRAVLFGDVDIKRARGTSATDEEVRRTADVAARMYERLAEHVGREALGYGHSGNGRSVFLALDHIPETPELELTVKGMLTALGLLFALRDVVEIDPVVSDAKRLGPAWGTTKRKGAPSIADRPHRRTAFVCAPRVRRVAFAELVDVLEKLRAELTDEQRVEVDRAMGVKATKPKPKPTEPSRATGNGPYDRANDVPIEEVADWLGLVDGDGPTCPGCSAHGDSSVAFVSNGLKCSHASCARKGAPRHPGFRTPVDLVAEHRGIDSREAVQLLADRFGFEGFRDTPSTEDDEAISFALTDLGNAERLVKRYGHFLRYCTPRRRWFVWDGKRWALDDSGVIVRVGKRTVRSVNGEVERCEDDDRRKALAKHARDSEKAGKIQAMIQLAQSEPSIPVRPGDLDCDPMLFNVANGTIDLRTGCIRSHSRADLITKLSPVLFDPDATHELWTRFLHDLTGGDDELAAYLQRMAGYALTGDVTEKKFFFAHGPKNTSKSTLIDALSTMLGDYHMSADFETWCSQSNTGGNRGDLVRLAGARLVTSVEVARGKKFDETLMKRVTGGDEITAAAKYESEITFRPTFKILLAANDAPRVRDDDDPLWSRLALIPFTHVIATPDPTVKARLRDARELGPAILAWAVRGCADWQANRLGQARAVDAASAAYRAEMDPLGDFFAERCIFDPTARITRAALRGAYETWAKENGVRNPLTPKEFATRLKDRGVEPADIRTQDGTRAGWKGVRMREVWEGGA